jgi:hypothetical protein
LTTTNTFAAAPAATESLLAADDSLSSALAALKKHQNNYAHILHLRSEALRLENQLKEIVRKCNAYTSDINAISPSMLEDSDSDDDEDPKGEVDYNTLLTLASRIATYNTAAQREADASLQRMKREAQMNGNSEAHPEPGVEITSVTDAEIARDRAMKGMAFPDAEILRLGALGRLQVIREQRGEDAVDDEIERLVMESEGGGPKPDGDVKMETENDTASSMPSTRARRASQTQRQGPAPTRSQQQLQERKKVNLDLWGGDDEEDDDD